MNEVIADASEGTLLRKGPLIELMRDNPHPRDVSSRAKKILAAVALGSNEPIPVISKQLVQAGITTSAATYAPPQTTAPPAAHIKASS